MVACTSASHNEGNFTDQVSESWANVHIHSIFTFRQMTGNYQLESNTAY